MTKSFKLTSTRLWSRQTSRLGLFLLLVLPSYRFHVFLVFKISNLMFYFSDSDQTSSSSHYVGIHTSSFKDFNLRPELLRTITECGFEHPSAGSLYSSIDGDSILARQAISWSNMCIIWAALHSSLPVESTLLSQSPSATTFCWSLDELSFFPNFYSDRIPHLSLSIFLWMIINSSLISFSISKSSIRMHS